MKTAILIVTVVLAAASGCTRRSVVDIEAHPTAPLLHLTADVHSGNNYAGQEFWTCVDQGSQVVCSPECGEHMELKCPLFATVIAVE